MRKISIIFGAPCLQKDFAVIPIKERLLSYRKEKRAAAAELQGSRESRNSKFSH